VRRAWATSVAVLLAAITFPAGGVYPSVWVPAAIVILAMALVMRPRIASASTFASAEHARALDLLLILAGVAVVIQFVPLPGTVLRRIDPHLLSLRAALLMPETLPLPISILPRDTLAALTIFGAAALLFWICREVCEIGGTGRLVRSIAIIGIIAAIAAIMQRGTNKELLYGYWRPLEAGARPYGPFVNRNHFATWAIMACPLIFGYLLARAPAAREGLKISQRFVSAANHLGTMRIWLAASVSVLTLAVLLSASRSGLIGLMAAFAISIFLSRRRHVPATRRWTIFQGVVLAVVVVSFANFNSVAKRFDETLAERSPVRGRTAIWHDAARLASDFRWTGTGAGTFGAAVVPYQTTEPGYTIGQAHNHYLQLAAEGGFMVSALAALIFVTFLLLFRRRMMEDDGQDYLIRAGAGAGIVGVMIQSLWDSGLRMPANAMLFAVLAAIAVHAPRQAPRQSAPSERAFRGTRR
jgi:O-antigen ligase